MTAALQFASLNPGAAQSRYSQLVRETAGLVAYWRLGESSGTVAYDEHRGDAPGLTHDGTHNGPLLNQAGLLLNDVSTAVLYDGVNDDTTIPDADALSPQAGAAGKISIEAWIRPGSPLQNGIVVTKFGTATTAEYRLRITSTGVVGLLIMDSAGATISQIDSAVGVIVADTTYHIVGTYDVATGTGNVYVNGSLSATTNTGVGTPVNSTGPIWIGQRGDAVNYFKGVIDEVALYNVVLSQTTISEHYNAGIPVGAALAGAVTASSATAATLSLDHALAGSIAGTAAAATTRLTLEHALASAVAGTSATSATPLTLNHALVGASAGLGATAADLSVGAGSAAALAGAVLAVSATSGQLTGPIDLYAVVIGSSAAGATGLSLEHAATGTSVGTAGTSGDLVGVLPAIITEWGPQPRADVYPVGIPHADVTVVLLAAIVAPVDVVASVAMVDVEASVYPVAPPAANVTQVADLSGYVPIETRAEVTSGV